MKIASRKKLLFTNFRAKVLLSLLLILILSACISSLEKAKINLTEARLKEETWQTEQAISLYRAAREEASREIKKNPSAQAYMVRGMAEVRLGLWSEASRSFALAATLGEEKAGDWAGEVSLYGLAVSLEQQGLEEPAGRLLMVLSEKGKFSPVVQAALGRLVDRRLASLEKLFERERETILSKTIDLVGKRIDSDPACGYYHYLLSQLLGHRKMYLESFQEAAVARELGLSWPQVRRDNDNQIIFCYQELKQSLSGEELASFLQTYRLWIKKWNWKDEETPDWKRR
ncbi:MAG: hypothetical protein QME28_08980 [Candidatus Saccharicenans sp.]|nr:hypothetical protein [Candidatus Saccharicenans sp.]